MTPPWYKAKHEAAINKFHGVTLYVTVKALETYYISRWPFTSALYDTENLDEWGQEAGFDVLAVCVYQSEKEAKSLV